MAKQKKSLGMLEKLDLCPEYREDGGKTPEVEIGRFKYFREVSKRRNSPLLIANLMFLLFLIPVLVLFVLLEVYQGTESIAYRMTKTSEIPYLLSGIGFGMSDSTATALDVKMNILNVYYIIFAALGVCAFIMSIGLGGMTGLSAKFIIGDSFASKKDNYGNDVPKAIKEFFKGVKRTWKEMLVVGAFFLVLFAGIANVFVYFVGEYWKKEANAGHWIMVIFAAIAALFILMYLVHLIPSIALYDQPLKGKMKNSAILTIQMFVQTLLIALILSLPFVIMAVLPLAAMVVVIAVMLCFGSKWYTLSLCNYEQYISEKIITPLYNYKCGKKQPKAKNKQKR